MNTNDKVKGNSVSLGFLHILSPRRTILFYSLMPIVIAALLIVFTLVSIEAHSRTHINRLTQSTADGIASLLKYDMNHRIESLSEFAKLSQLTGDMTNDQWQSASKTLYNIRSDYQAIGWIDNNYYIRRVMPNEGNELAKGVNLALNSHE
jgi:two-component system sensor kinase FixL